MNSYCGFSSKIVDLVSKEILDRIDDYKGCEYHILASEMFNNDYYIIGTKKAQKFIGEHIEDMFVLNERFKNIWGAELTFNDPETLASTLVLMVAEVIISNLKCKKENDVELIKEELREVVECC